MAPHLLELGQIQAILRAALDLGPKGSISPYTFHYLFGFHEMFSKIRTVDYRTGL